jgi:serine phosphatase RsbU (regulator of sigma subunit)
MRRIVFIFLFPFFASANKDSLLLVLKSNLHDTLKANAMSRLITAYENAGNDSATLFAGKLYDLSFRTKNLKGLGEYYNYTGRKYYYVQSFDSALVNFKRSLSWYEKAGFIKGIVSASTNMAAVYLERGDNKKCLQFYKDLARTCLEKNAENQLGTIYSNIAVCFDKTGVYDSCVYYHDLSVRIYQKFDRPDLIPGEYINLAIVNSNMKQDKKAMEFVDRIFLEKLPFKKNQYSRIWCLKASFFRNMRILDSASVYAKKAIESAGELKDQLALIGAYSIYAQILADLKNYEESERICRLQLEVAQSIGAVSSFDRAYHDLAQILLLRGKYKESIEYFRKALTIEIETDNRSNTFQTLKGLSQAQIKNGQTDSAFMFLDSALRFSLHSNETQRVKDMNEIETRYETDKKDLQIEKANTEIEMQAETNKQKSRVIWIGAGALAFTLFFGMIAFRNYRKSQKANETIVAQNASLEQQKKEVEFQKQLVEEKQHEIIASINYAQRIQSAVLTGEDVWKRISKEYFILFQPKDIVSGDFYWAHVLQNGRAVFAVADCTGHGVPGGFMSMLGNSFLNEIVVENKIFSAAKILNKLREKVIKALEQKGQTQQQDGMDIALCVWNKMDNTLEFAGANNNLYISRKGELKEIKGSKMPIGTYVNEKNEFESQTIQLEKEDTIYLTTDGFVDQFGGPKGKKYKYSQLEAVLQSLQGTLLEQQAEILKLDFENWKGNSEQTDDVCVIGIKVG